MNPQSLARLVTDAVVRRPVLWRVFRGRTRDLFDEIAPTWETRLGPHHLGAMSLALDELPSPRRVLDLGTGTGIAAFALARRYPESEVVGVDLSPRMIAQAEAKLDPEATPHLGFEVGDASALPYDDGAFDLVTLMNAIPFFDELVRVTAPDGAIVFSFSRGDETPIYVPAERLRRELERRGFTQFANFVAEPATALLARRR